MRAIRIDNVGGPEVLRLVEVPPPALAPDQARVEVELAGVNYADLLQRSGTYPLPLPLPFVPGWEVVGRVAEVGPEVTEVTVGERVAAWLGAPGGYAEQVAVPQDRLVVVPPDVDATTALGFLSQGLTAWFLVNESARPRHGRWALVHAAAGGVGSLLVQLARARGARVLAAVSGLAKQDTARELGADAVVDYARQDWVSMARALVGEAGIDVVYASAGGQATQDSFALLGPFGRIVLYGASDAASGAIDNEQLVRMIFGNQAAIGFAIFGHVSPGAPLRAAFDALVVEHRAGRLRVLPGERFPLDAAADAHRAVGDRRTIGKVVLAVR